MVKATCPQTISETLLAFLACTLLTADAGISAEGDNAVLIQKVAKELLAAVKKGTVKYDLNLGWNGNYCQLGLLKLIRLREQRLASQLDSEMKRKMGSGKSLFDVWMGEESDTIQALGRAFGERVCAEAFLGKCKGEPVELTQVYELYCLARFVSFYFKHLQ